MCKQVKLKLAQMIINSPHNIEEIPVINMYSIKSRRSMDFKRSKFPHFLKSQPYVDTKNQKVFPALGFSKIPQT